MHKGCWEQKDAVSAWVWGWGDWGEGFTEQLSPLRKEVCQMNKGSERVWVRQAHVQRQGSREECGELVAVQHGHSGGADSGGGRWSWRVRRIPPCHLHHTQECDLECVLVPWEAARLLFPISRLEKRGSEELTGSLSSADKKSQGLNPDWPEAKAHTLSTPP